MKTTKKDYYEILGVPRDADQKRIKAAYRKLARAHHPDLNQGDTGAEERFKEIAEAFAVLSDPAQRARYDRGGHAAFGPEFDPFAGVNFREFDFGVGFPDLEELFGGLFGSRRGAAAGPRRGEDLHAEVRVAFIDAVQGTTVELGFAGAGRTAKARRLKVRIPPGIEHGDRVRLPGKGNPGVAGGPPGDVFLRVHVDKHPLLRRQGRDLLVDVPIGVVRATLGGNVDVPTLEGRATIQVPAGTRSGQKLRLKGRGVPATASREAGDLYAVIQIHPPKPLSAESRRLFEQLARLDPDA